MEIDLELLNLIPDEILNLIWKYIKPSVKYIINKKYFNKYYKNRLGYINNKRLKNCNNISISDCYIIKNFDYIKYLINIDAIYIFTNIIEYKMKHDKSKFMTNKNLKFENIKFNNFIDFCYFYSKKFNSQKILPYIDSVIKQYNKDFDVVVYGKNKNYKYVKNKNIRWSA